MEKRFGMLSRIAGLLAGFAFIFIGMLLLLLGLTFLPVIGVLVGLPVIRMACFFLCPEVPLDTAEQQAHSWEYLAEAA
jgi:hypothetical protein